MHAPKMSRGHVALIILTALSTIRYTFASCYQRTMLRADGLSAFEQQAILDMHNRLRQAVALGQAPGQAPAANMLEMKWDNRLARRAQQWASTCSHYTHDPGRHLSKEDLVGQNIATSWTTKHPSSFYDTSPDFSKDAITKWFNEMRHYGGGRAGVTGHYTQLVWAETNSVGCGFAFYYDPSKGFTKHYVCNYSPSGNVIGENLYKKGFPSCYAYGLSESRKYHGLCDKPSNRNFFYDFHNFVG